MLRPLDRPGSLPNLMQYMINPNFDSRQFPVLDARLRGNGVRLAPPAAVPHACPARAARDRHSAIGSRMPSGFEDAAISP